MILLQRRHALIAGAAAGATLASALWPRKPLAAEPGAGTALPDIQWRLADGTVRTIADYAGKGVVLNLWATWCVPCVAEMPALDAMAGVVGPGVVVLPLSSDRGGAPAVERFYRERGVKNLPVLLDPTGAAARALGARGIPTTLLIDTAGQERGRLEGGADWDSAQTVAMVRLLGRS